jgi:hypothetical protein
MPASKKSRTCKTQVNTLLLLGQRVKVRKGGLVWINPDDGKIRMIGTTRAEALETLEKWKANRAAYMLASPGRSESQQAEGLGRIIAPKAGGRRTTILYESGEPIEYFYKKALYYARARASRSGRAVMSAEDFARLIARANGACEVTGIRFTNGRSPEERKAMWSPSLDRLDCAGGYEFENCRLVCVAVNIALNEFGVEPLLKIAAALVRPK